MVKNKKNVKAVDTQPPIVERKPLYKIGSSSVIVLAIVVAATTRLWAAQDDSLQFARFKQPALNVSDFDPRLPRNWIPLPELYDHSADMESHRKFIQEGVIKKGVAAVIKGSKFVGPMQKWGIERFEDHCRRKSVEVLPEVKVQRARGSFLNYDTRNKAMIEQGYESAQESRREAYYSYNKASVSKFWKAMGSTHKQDIASAAESQDDDVKLAMTIGVNQLCGGALSADLADPWWENFIHPEQSKYPELPASRNIWMGVPGVTTSWHFDTYTNFFMHLAGSKRVLILPPSAYYDLYFYPALHPYYRKSQIVWEDFENLSTQAMSMKFPGWLGHSIQAVTLSPGDVLYLPPFWNHRVETLGKESSVDLNFWSSSDESMMSMHFLTKLKNVVDTDYDPSTALDFFQAVIYQIVKTAFPDVYQRQQFFDNLIHRQYMRSSGTQFDRSKCRQCEAPIAFEEGRQDSAMTLQVLKIANEVVSELHNIPTDVRPIIISFVIEKGINKLFFEDVHTDICFIIQCLANHLILL